jgi:hypothetical protein
MAKGSSKAASYFIRKEAEKANEPQKWAIAKFSGARGGDSEQPENTYEITQLNTGIRRCSCPASWGGRKNATQPCKHLGWLQRWEALYTTNKVSPGTIVYYWSGDDRFYPAPGLLMDNNLESW